ncbi:MAG: hypothetical protein LBE31_03565 [Deltaproteobacteria bacterium]|jgi:hypothetical protein|nr:hypothetical protein [Deltaproteobacteria bacterium]
MSSINPQAKNHALSQTTASREAWREEMLGQFLQKMRDQKLPEEPSNPSPPKGAYPFKGRYLDVYV